MSFSIRNNLSTEIVTPVGARQIPDREKLAKTDSEQERARKLNSNQKRQEIYRAAFQKSLDEYPRIPKAVSRAFSAIPALKQQDKINLSAFWPRLSLFTPSDDLPFDPNTQTIVADLEPIVNQLRELAFLYHDARLPEGLNPLQEIDWFYTFLMSKFHSAKPVKLGELLEMAEQLPKQTDFTRVAQLPELAKIIDYKSNLNLDPKFLDTFKKSLQEIYKHRRLHELQDLIHMVGQLQIFAEKLVDFAARYPEIDIQNLDYNHLDQIHESLKRFEPKDLDLKSDDLTAPHFERPANAYWLNTEISEPKPVLKELKEIAKKHWFLSLFAIAIFPISLFIYSYYRLNADRDYRQLQAMKKLIEVGNKLCNPPQQPAAPQQPMQEPIAAEQLATSSISNKALESLNSPSLARREEEEEKTPLQMVLDSPTSVSDPVTPTSESSFSSSLNPDLDQAPAASADDSSSSPTSQLTRSDSIVSKDSDAMSESSLDENRENGFAYKEPQKNILARLAGNVWGRMPNKVRETANWAFRSITRGRSVLDN